MVILGLGSNLGDREHNLRECIKLLSPYITFQHISPILESPAMLPDNAPDRWDTPYLNMVAAGKTSLTAPQLLAQCKATEGRLGRPAEHLRWSPRIIDIDILDYNGVVIESTALTLPHPGIAERRFVLEPLMETIPEWKHPVTGLTAKQMMEAR